MSLLRTSAVARTTAVTRRHLPRIRLQPLSSLSTTDTGLSFRSATYSWTWLRDACQCPTCVHPSTRQKLHRTSDVVGATPLKDAIVVDGNGVKVRWTGGHESVYPLAFLERHSSAPALAAFHRDVPLQAWDGAGMANTPGLLRPYASLQNPPDLLSAYTHLLSYGLLFVSGVPNAHTDDATCELPRLAARFGEIRDTFYGRVWDVKNVRDSKNIAYTNLNLDLHMDLLYFEHPPRYQILHCLRNQVVGGASIFVDALHAAKTLHQQDKDSFDLLTQTPVEYHYINDGHHLHHSHPVIELDAFASGPSDTPCIKHINYSPPFQAPLSPDTPAAFYTALRKFADILDAECSRFKYTLREGDAVIFDNRRVLHARTAFSEREDMQSLGEGETNRWLKGCYLEADALLDRTRVLGRKIEHSDFDPGSS